MDMKRIFEFNEKELFITYLSHKKDEPLQRIFQSRKLKKKKLYCVTVLICFMFRQVYRYEQKIEPVQKDRQ